MNKSIAHAMSGSPHDSDTSAGMFRIHSIRHIRHVRHLHGVHRVRRLLATEAAVCVALTVAPLTPASAADAADDSIDDGIVYAMLGIDGSADVQYRLAADAGADGTGSASGASSSEEGSATGSDGNHGSAADAGMGGANPSFVTEDADLPWDVTVLFTKDGPETDASSLVGASGMIGVEVRLRGRTNQARGLVPVVAFSVPSAVTDDVTGDGVTVSHAGADLFARAQGGVGGDADFRFTMNAKDFRLGPIVIAAVPSDANAASANANTGAHDTSGTGNRAASGTDTPPSDASIITRADALATDAQTFADSQTGAGSESDQRLIASLQTMRDEYRAKAKSDDATTDQAYARMLANYMATFAQAYAGHLSGAPGTSTQMGAVAQLYSDLNGDTPMAKAVNDIAAAVDARSDARRSDGAADALDEIITRIKRQGSAGLAADLAKESKTEATGGDADYKTGQDQLRAAMVPYSMAYIDAYTKNLNDQVNAGQSIAGGHQAAVDATNAGWERGSDAAGYHRQIQSALDTLATARERNGKADVCKRVLSQFAEQLKADDATDGGAGAGASGVGGGSGAGAGVDGVGAPALSPTVKQAGIAAGLRAVWGASSVPTLRKDASWMIDDAVGISQGAGVLLEGQVGGTDGGASDGGTSDGGTSDGGASDGGADTATNNSADGVAQDGGTSDGGASDGGADTATNNSAAGVAQDGGYLLALPAVDATTAGEGQLKTSLWTKIRRLLSLD